MLIDLPPLQLALHESLERIASSGPANAKIMVIGEAPGKDEIMRGVPFVGASGRELRKMLDQAGIDPEACYFTNVFMTRPKENKVDNYCAKKAVVGKDYSLPPLKAGHYVVPELLFELVRLASEIDRVKPKLIIALGNTAIWALIGQTGISKVRGNKFISTLLGAEGYDVIPTYHPSAILRQWDLRVVAVQDFIKCERYVREGFTLPRRELLLDPTLREVEEWLNKNIWWPFKAGRLCGPVTLDIETKAETITMIGFAPDKTKGICIPFFDPRKKPSQNYWPTFEEERAAYRLCCRVLEDPRIEKLGQNGLYDIQYLFRYHCRVRNYTHDTMIRHHSLYPELEKGLGFMGSVYTDEAPWKLMRARNKENFKLDDE